LFESGSLRICRYSSASCARFKRRVGEAAQMGAVKRHLRLPSLTRPRQKPTRCSDDIMWRVESFIGKKAQEFHLCQRLVGAKAPLVVCGMSWVDRHAKLHHSCTFLPAVIIDYQKLTKMYKLYCNIVM
jgi:hypothetical protein